MRSQNRGFYQTRKRPLQQILIPAVIIIAIVSTVLFFVLRGSGEIFPDDDSSRLNAAWNAGDYKATAELSDELLAATPLDATLLMYNGFSHFYYGITLVNHDERQDHLNKALFSLRKLLYNPPSGFQDEIWYILGKIYFHKGSYFYDSALEYLTKARDAGIDKEDVLEYLGVISIDMGKGEEGISYILQAIDKNPRDMLYFTAAEEYEKLSQYDKAMDFYGKSLEMTDDSYLAQESRIGEGRVLFSEDRLDDAKKLFEQVIEENSQAAEAYYYLGEIYSAKGDNVKARANWREAYNQDRTFTPALERLQS